MKKYFLPIIPFSSIVILFLYFTLNPQNALAATNTVQCTCDNPGAADGTNSQGQQINNNGYHCGNQGGLYKDPSDNQQWQYAGSCGNKEDGCFQVANNQIGSTTPVCAGRGGCNTTPTNFVGVECKPGTVQGGAKAGQTAIQCQCDANGPKSGTGEPTSIQCINNTDPNMTWANAPDIACGGQAICTKGSGLSFTWTANGSVVVPGIGCEQQCVCQGTNGTPGSKSKTGNNNNGEQCYTNGTLGAVQPLCTNREDYCQNNPNATNGVSCINSTTCTCSSDKTSVVCTSAGSGANGATETVTIGCGGGQQCMAGAQYSTPNVFNQTVKGAQCSNVELPPPPSPPCKKWSNGQCTTFASALGDFATDPAGFVQYIFAVLLSVSGGIALLLIIRAGYQLMASQGKPEQIQNGRDQLIAAIVGLVFLIFAFVFLQLIGVDIFHLPGFS